MQAVASVHCLLKLLPALTIKIVLYWLVLLFVNAFLCKYPVKSRDSCLISRPWGSGIASQPEQINLVTHKIGPEQEGFGLGLMNEDTFSGHVQIYISAVLSLHYTGNSLDMKQPAAIPLAVALIVVTVQKSKPLQLNNQVLFLSLSLALFCITVAPSVFSMQSFLACIETSFFCQQLEFNFQALKSSVTLVPQMFTENITGEVTAFLMKNFKNLSLRALG